MEKRHQKHRRIATVESDSDEDVSSRNTQVNDKDNEGEQILNNSIVKRGVRRVFDSDSDDDTELSSNKTINTSNNNESSGEKTKKVPLLDSDSEDEEVKSYTEKGRQSMKLTNFTSEDVSDDEQITPHNKSFSQSSDPNQTAIVYTTNKKGELIPEDSIQQQKSKLSALCDPDSSEDEEISNNNNANIFEEFDQDNLIQPIPYKKKPSKKSNEPKEKKMTAKQAVKQRQEIRSESLKMLRESNIALPYHRPKSYTLKEFLQKRSSFSSALPIDAKTPPAVAIKMSRQQLEVISKKLKEREKQVEEFFKSESESDSEETNTEEVALEKTDCDKPEEGNQKDKNDINKSDSTAMTDNSGIENIENDEPLNKQENSSIEEKVNGSVDITHEPENSDNSCSKLVILQNIVISSAEVNTETGSTENVNNMDPTKMEDSINTQEETFTKSDDDLSHKRETGEFGAELNEGACTLKNNSGEVGCLISEGANDQSSEALLNEETLALDGGKTVLKEDALNDAKSEENSFTKVHCHFSEDSLAEKTPGKNSKEAAPKESKAEQNILEEKKDSEVTDNQPQNVKDNDNDHDEMDYTFNLDDIEDEQNNSKELCNKNNENIYCLDSVSEEIPGEDGDNNAQKSSGDQMLSNNDGSAINRHVPDGEKPPVEKKLSKLEMLKEKLINVQPKLSGSPDEVIDLESGVVRPNEINQLVLRFMKHTAKKAAPKQVHLSIVSVTGGEIHKETVNMNVDQDEEPVAVMEKPGAKLQKLRDELQIQMAQKRSELWQKKNVQLGSENNKSIEEDEENKCNAEDEILDDEEEAELTDDDSVEDEEEEEIDDCDLTDEPKKTSAFVDDEAEESDEGHEDNGPVEEDDDEFSKQSNEGDVVDNATESKDAVEEEAPKSKVLKRILKPFGDDTDDESSSDSLHSTPTGYHFVLKQGGKQNSLVNNDDEDITPHQKPQFKTPQKIESADAKSDLDFFLTPVSYLTGLQNLNSGSKYLRDSPHVSPFAMQNIPSPLREDSNPALQKKLFQDLPDNGDSQPSSSSVPDQNSDSCTTQDFTDVPSTQELLGVCSGSFSGISQIPNQVSEDACTDKEIISQPLTKDLSAVSSEGFDGMIPEKSLPKENPTENKRFNEEEDVNTQDLLAVCSGKFTGFDEVPVSDKAPSEAACSATQIQFVTQSEETKQLDEDQDNLISQLLDEEELEQFKKKFDSPPEKPRKAKVNLDADEVVGSGAVIDSDDENELLEVKKKKKQKKLTFSDDELSSDEEIENEEEEEIDLHDEVGSDVDDKPPDAVEYDSEENEIEVKSHETKAYKASDFFEKEAELSESDWGSEDEDEKDLDELEFEQADNENIDEEKVKNDLEKIHMRRILDDDAHEVKLLQELLLEDGELHGTGRQRQFRWKNIDSIGEENGEQKDNDLDVYLDEEESEEQWRKMRYQREMFLKEKRDSQTLEDDEISSESQILTFGQKVIVKSQSCSQSSTPVEETKNKPTSPKVERPLTLLNKRGSFLTRNEQVLQRLAEITKVETVQQNGGMKKAKNFVFQTVSIEEEETVTETKKRKAEDGTPNAIKKLRITNLTPLNTKRKNVQANKAKQLFNF